jgi:hypothetical protein
MKTMGSAFIENLLEWAREAGPSVFKTFSEYLETGKTSVYGADFCLRVRELGNEYGTETIERACCELRKNGGIPTLRMVRKILENGGDFSTVSICARNTRSTGGLTRGAPQFSIPIENQKEDPSNE